MLTAVFQNRKLLSPPSKKPAFQLQFSRGPLGFSTRKIIQENRKHKQKNRKNEI